MDLSSIDQLLERYLVLLDEYTTLRESLSTAQSNMYHNIARANFAAERGLRYGQDQYDERMQASRRVEITPGQGSTTSRFTIHTTAPDVVRDAEDAGREKGEKPLEEPSEQGESDDEVNEARQRSDKPRDPLQWFGLLTPMSLRLAQSQAIQVVESLVPRLASVSAEMEALEIEVRRARKKRAKANVGKDEARPSRIPGRVPL